MKLTQADRTRISDAIADAEKTTSGEIFCILADHVADYRETPVVWAAGAALIVPLALIPLGFGPDWLPAWLPGNSSDWSAGHASALTPSLGALIAAYALVQAVVFTLVLGLVSIPPVKRALTSRALKRKRAHETALAQFMAKGLHLTRSRTGVLIFAARGERQVEVVADEGIHAKVGEAVWNEAVAALTRRIREGRAADGFVEAIGLCGKVLAEHFPPEPGDTNELPNEVVEI